MGRSTSPPSTCSHPTSPPRTIAPCSERLGTGRSASCRRSRRGTRRGRTWPQQTASYPRHRRSPRPWPCIRQTPGWLIQEIRGRRLSHLSLHRHGPPRSRRWHPSATGCSSPWGRKRTTRCGGSKTCWPQIPDGDPAAIVSRALSHLLKEVERKKLGATRKERPPRPTGDRSRHVPAHIRRAVHDRDGGRCAFLGRDGRRCAETGRLEYHHIRPYAADGEMSV